MALVDLAGGVAGSRIHVPKTSEVVADRIRARIVRRELGKGDCLPPEGQLMDSVRISHPTLREAFRIRETEGLISVVRGSRTGANVHKPSVDLVSRYAAHVLESQGATIADLCQARLAIEPSAVRWLADEQGGDGLPDLRSPARRDGNPARCGPTRRVHRVGRGLPPVARRGNRAQDPDLPQPDSAEPGGD